ncbi:zinc finger protein 808 isoform X3 [Hydra vulgaris]|uniref:Zinc finger protein 808 isoform X3 n=1 Tax=Hydra vulgaris TaxID=6087 RepID=A0ABM4CSP4_HYDVU
MIKNKFSIRKILQLKVENEMRFFEVEWEKTWENEEYIRQIAPGLLDEFLSKENSYDVKYKNETTPNETSDTIASFTCNESMSKPRRIGGIQAVISRLKMSQCLEQKPAIYTATKDEQCNDQVVKRIDIENINKSPNQIHDPDRSKFLIVENNSTEGYIHQQYSSLTHESYSNLIPANNNSKFTSSFKSHHSPLSRENSLNRNTSSHGYNQLSGENTKLSFDNSGVFFKCSICSEILYEDVKYRQHMYMHEQVSLLKKDPPKLLKPGTFECKFCNMIFDGKDKLKTHYNENHEKEFVNTQPTDQLYSCSQCHQSFLILSALQKHLEMHPLHAAQASENIKVQNSDENVAKIKEEIELEDYSDQQSCNTSLLYLSSQNQKVSENKNFLNKSPSMATMTALDFQPINEALLLKKGECRLIDNLDEKKFFRCNLCDEMFETESDRAQHSLIHVDRSNSLDCHVCGKQFRHRTNLTTHLIVHSGVKPHQCAVCFRRFTQKVNLQRHMHIHEGSRPYRCSMCSKSFTQKANLQRHILSHTEQNKDDFVKASRDILSESDFIDESNDFIDDGVEKNAYLSSTKEFSDVSNNNENLISFDRQEFRCDICEKTFAQKANLHKHLLIHSGSKPFQCYVCGKAFRQRSSLQKHYTIHTNGSSSFMCQTCNRMFGSRTNLQRHMLVHVTSNTECYICYQKCTTSDNLERHFSEHIEEASLAMSLPQKYFEKSSGETFYCVDCGINFDNPIVYNQHLQCHQREFSDESHINNRLHDGASPLQCEVCGVIFMSSTKLKEHIEAHHTLSKNSFDPNSKLNVSSVQSSKLQELNKSLVPKLKDEQISTPIEFVSRHDNRLENHKEKKTTRVSRCPLCKQLFLSKIHMKEHYATVHSGENLDLHKKSKNVNQIQSQSFSISPKQFETDTLQLNTSSAFSIHKVETDEKDDGEVELITEDEEQMIKDNQEFIKDNILGGSHEYESKGRYERGNYSCKICNRTLTYKYSLEKHMLIHTGIYPYKCHLCSKRFNHKPNLDKHLIVHSGEKPHVCHLCHRAFSQRSNLQRHQLTHTQNRDFVCEICGKRFNHMASLKTHSLIHTGAKPFSCYICTKRFNQKGNLKRHVQTHKTGKRNRLSNESKNNEVDFNEENLSYYNGENSENSEDELSSHYNPIKKEDYMSAEEPLPTMLDDLNQSNSITSERSEQPKTSVLEELNHDNDDILTIVPSDELSEFGKQKMKTKKESYHCDSCSKLFVSMASLESHKRAHHSLIVCDVCGKQFSQKANLLKHKLIHMNKKPFPCQTCHKAFRQKANLQRHEMIHNKERKSLTCELCQKSFRCLWSLKQHVKNHPERTSFSCTFCGETFDEKAQLLRHYIVHKGITVYSCCICLQKYQSKDNLLAHMTTHENVPLDIQQRIEEDEGQDLLTQDDIPVDNEPTFVAKMES